MSSLEVRQAMRTDSEAVWRLVSESFAGPRSELTPVGQHGYRRYLGDRLEESPLSNKRMYVGTDNGEICCFADVTMLADGGRFLTRICVAGAYRGRALASRMLKQIDVILPGQASWELDVFADNKSAMSLYRRLGLSEVSRNMWRLRTVPVATRRGGSVKLEPISPEIFGHYRRYGFSPLTYSGRDLALAGDVVRCYSWRDFCDDELLKNIQVRIPDVRRALLVHREEPKTGREKSTRPGSTVAVSVRMSGILY